MRHVATVPNHIQNKKKTDTSFKFLFRTDTNAKVLLFDGTKINAGDMDECEWRLELEMIDWDLGGGPDVLPKTEDYDQDIEPGNV